MSTLKLTNLRDSSTLSTGSVYDPNTGKQMYDRAQEHGHVLHHGPMFQIEESGRAAQQVKCATIGARPAGTSVAQSSACADQQLG